MTALAIPEEREKYYDSDSVSCLANLANMTADEKIEIDEAREALRGERGERGIIQFNEQGVIKRLHQFIRSEKAYFLPIIDPIDLYQPYFVHPKMSNRRILAQSGPFIIHGLRPPARMFFPYEIQETEFIVPAVAKGPIRQALENLGINASTLFPEIDKAADRIKDALHEAVKVSRDATPFERTRPCATCPCRHCSCRERVPRGRQRLG